MTEVGKKIAVVVNGDTQRESWAHHQQNVDRSIGVLEKQGYEVFCLNTERPRGVDQDHYFSSTQEGLRALKEKLQLKTGADTDLVIYTTGHGYRIKEQGTLCLSDGCDADTVASVFDKIPYSQRTVIMDQCYSGNWNKIFLDDPKTLFVSGGGKNETDSCQEIAPAFWAGNVPDVNGDGVISWQERYAHALAYPVFHSVPQFVPSEGYRQEGAPPFSKEVVTVEDKNALQEQLKKIKPGQYAIITFSASWCGACRGYKPVFDRLASEGGGQHLWLRTEDESLAQDWNLPGFPTVVIVDATGHRFIVDENQRNDIPKVLADFTLSTEDRFSRRLAAIEGIGNEEARLNQLMDFAVALAASDIQDQAAFFNKLTTVAEGFQTPGICANVLTVIASTLVQSKVMEEKEEIFKSLVTIANMNIQDLQERAVALGGISVCLCRSKSDWGISLFEEAITLARGILDPGERANTLSRIAFSLFRARMLDRGGSILQESLSIVESIPVVQTDTVWMNMSNCLVQIALLEDIRLREETMPLLAKADSFAMNVQNRQDRCKILVSNAFALARAGLLEKAASVFKESIIMVESMEGEPTRLNALKYIVSVLAHVDLKKHLIPVCKKLLVVVEPIHDERERSILGDNISNILYQNGFKGEIHVLRLWGPVKLFGHPIPLLTGPLIVTVK